MTSSIKEMSCGHPLSRLRAWDGEGPWVPAWQHSSLSWRCLRWHGSLQPPGSCHIPPADVKHWEGVLSCRPLARLPPGRTLGRRLLQGSPGCFLGRTGAGMQVSRNTNPFRNTLLAFNRLQGLHPGLSPQCPTETPEPPALPAEPVMGASSCPRSTGCWAPCRVVDMGIMGGFPRPSTPLFCQKGQALSDSRWVPAPRTTQCRLSAPSLRRCSRCLLWKLLLFR